MDSPHSPDLPDLALLLGDITRELREREIPFMLIGGQAVLLHGRPRLTDDIDITLGVDPGALDVMLAACAALDLEPLPADPEAFVHETFVLPAAHGATRQRVDFIFSSTPYERQAIERAVSVDAGGAAVPFAAAEDLLIHKLFAGRARDIEDAESIARRQARKLDWDYVEHWAAQFAALPGREDMPARVEKLRAAAEQERGEP